jgi:hypothetical protein
MQNERKLIWPDWLVLPSEENKAALEAIARVHSHLREFTGKKYIHKVVLHEQSSFLVKEAMAAGAVVKNAKGEFEIKSEKLRGVKSHPSYYAAIACDFSTPRRTFDRFIASSQITAVRLLDGFTICVQTDDLLVPFIVLRSLLEHVARCHVVLEYTSKISELQEFDAAKAALGSIRDKLQKEAHGTRIDWDKMVATSDYSDLKAKNVEYKPKELLADIKSSQILGAVDDLDKTLKGTRVIYELLCEFAHPNVGALLISTNKRNPWKDKNGVFWREQYLELVPPISFVRTSGQVVPQLLKKMAEALEHYLQLLETAKVQSQKLERLTQVLIREAVSRHPERFDIYETCPCGSSKKLKFCCSAKN